MSKYARISNGIVLEVVDALAFGTFNATVKAMFTSCPDNVQAGYSFTAPSTWAVPAASPAPAPSYAQLTPMQFYLAFTPAERIAIKGSSDATVQEFWATYQLAMQTNTPINPNLTSVAEGLQYLRDHDILTTDERIAQIKSGTAQ